jgi:hypothetical protein
MARPRNEYDFSPTPILTPAQKLYQYEGAVTDTGNVSKATIETFGGTASDFVRNRAQEAAAIASGSATKEEIEARGGVNASGYYGDSYNPATSLTDAEYAAADAEGGVAAINAALAAKQAKLPGGSSGAASKPSAADLGLGTTPTTSTAKVDQIAAISALLSSYGLGDLTGALTEAVQKGYSNDTIQLIMQDPNSKDPLAVAFQTRFSGNKARFAAGKPVLSPGEYLAAEKTYSQVLQSYGVGTLATKATMSSFISGDISAAEVADRVGLAIDRVKNADPFTKAALAEYYPSLNQTDIVSALLDPAEGLPALKRKVQIAEIGGAASIQGLKTGLTTTSGVASGYQGVTTGSLGAESLAQYGITQEEARKGYQAVAEIAPRAEFLSSISGGDDYTRLEAEQEAFLGLASAKRKRLSLTEEEQNRFAGSAGTSRGSFSTQYLNKSSSSGQF